MAENKVKFNLLSQVWFVLKVALLRRKVEFPVGEEIVVSTSSVAVRMKPSSTKSGSRALSTAHLHPLVKFNTARSVLIGTIHEEDGSKWFRGYFRTNLYFMVFALWPLPIYLGWALFTLAGIITFRDDPSTLGICVFGLLVIVPGANFLRYMAEGIIDEEEAYVEAHKLASPSIGVETKLLSCPTTKMHLT